MKSPRHPSLARCLQDPPQGGRRWPTCWLWPVQRCPLRRGSAQSSLTPPSCKRVTAPMQVSAQRVNKNIHHPSSGYPESGWGNTSGKAVFEPLHWRGTQWNIKCWWSDGVKNIGIALVFQRQMEYSFHLFKERWSQWAWIAFMTQPWPAETCNTFINTLWYSLRLKGWRPLHENSESAIRRE